MEGYKFILSIIDQIPDVKPAVLATEPVLSWCPSAIYQNHGVKYPCAEKDEHIPASLKHQ